MKTFLLVKLSLIPAILFWTLSGFGYHQAAVFAGASTAVIAMAFHYAYRRFRPMELAMALYLVALSGLAVAGVEFAHWAVAVSFLLQGIVGFATCLWSEPWTSAYAASEHQEAQHSPIFHRVNLVLSLLWSAIFMATALFMLIGFDAVILPLTLFGVVLSIFGPAFMIRLALNAAIKARETYHWRQEPLKSDGSPDSYDVAIIGAGIGGLTAAALLAQAGKTVFIADQHVVPGGYCHCWLRKTRHEGVARVFRFDSGVHDISGVRAGGPVSSLLEKLGIAIEWLPFHHYFPGMLERQPQGWRAYARQLGERFPESADDIMRFFAAVKQLFDGLYSVGDLHSHVPLPPKTAKAMLAFAKAQPLLIHWMEKPFAEFLGLYIKDKQVQRQLMLLSGYVTDDKASLSVFDMVPLYGYYFFGGFYPKGGSGILGEKLAQTVRRYGGEVALKSPVVAITVENGRATGIRLVSGRHIKASAVISNADIKKTMLDLVPQDAVSPALRAHYEAVEPATSAFMVHLGITGQPPLSGSASVTTKDGLRIGIVSPSGMDDSAAPDGYGTLELIALLPHAEARRWFADETLCDDKTTRQSDSYLARKRAFGDTMIEAATHIIPDLASRIVLRTDASPLTFSRYDWASGGAIYGVSKRHRLKGHKSPIEGLWFAGAATNGAGIEAVMIAGAAVAEALVPDILATQPDSSGRPVNPPEGNVVKHNERAKG